MSFQLIRGVNSTAVITGTDRNGVSGNLIVNTEKYDAWVETTRMTLAGEQFEEKIRAFFSPLLEAVDALDEKPVDDPLDPRKVIVREQESQAPIYGVSITLDLDGTLIQAVEDGHHDRLIWVDRALFITAPVADAPVTNGDPQGHISHSVLDQPL